MQALFSARRTRRTTAQAFTRHWLVSCWRSCSSQRQQYITADGIRVCVTGWRRDRWRGKMGFCTPCSYARGAWTAMMKCSKFSVLDSVNHPFRVFEQWSQELGVDNVISACTFLEYIFPWVCIGLYTSVGESWPLKTCYNSDCGARDVLLWMEKSAPLSAHCHFTPRTSVTHSLHISA